MSQPTPKPKTIYEMNIAELRTTLVEMVSSGNYHFSPNDYANELQRRYIEEANQIAQ